MKFIGLLFSVALAGQLCAGTVNLTLSPSVESGFAATFPVEVDFSGTVSDSDGYDACNDDITQCFNLNDLSVTFDQSVATSNLSANTGFFYSNVAGFLSGDTTTAFFFIYIDPNTPAGQYTGTATITGNFGGASPDTILASANWELDVAAPEPAAFGLALFGLSAVLLAKRVAA